MSLHAFLPRLTAALAPLLLAASAPGADAPGSPPERPNVLLICADDLTSCLDEPGVVTPNLDRLRERSVTFERAYCQYPLCNPSRSSMLSGLRPDTTGIYGNGTPIREAVPDVVTLPQLFKKNGYFTARVGKIYHYGNPGDIGTDSLDDPESWNRVINPAGRDKAEEGLIVNYTPKRGLGSSLSVLEAAGTDLEQTDGLVAVGAEALMTEHLNKNPGKPFFIAAGFFRPHCPYVAPKAHFEPYPQGSVTVPPFDGQPAGVPDAAVSNIKPYPWYGVTKEQADDSKRAYYASVTFLDANVGRLLDALDEAGQTENTIVVFWSDHGYHLGEKGLFKKQSLYERAARAPMTIAAPGVTDTGAGAGGTCERPVEFVDLYPTLADLAGLGDQAPERLEGVSLVPLLKNPAADWDRPAFTQTQRNRKYGGMGYSVRNARWRFTRWGDGSTELYDHSADPDEDRNLAADPQHAGTAKELAALLDGYGK
ncbi:sulfatase [Alienimonas californiensis]|uniref:Choline-sulfatase n=1 Tax=Alienimonas californiensis TaxID=2527989 RepID=A0A517P7D4_9PLAN|nr:sulfatase [Alienimonas californiensis]QDT15289.1 Choline-sulfatase [Alienimonas californiensis]